MKNILILFSFLLLTSCGTMYRSINDKSLINKNGYNSILFIYTYYPEDELDFFELYFERLEELFEHTSTRIASTYIQIESFDKDFIKPNQATQDQINTEIFNHKADLIVFVKNVGGYINGGAGNGVYQNTATDLKLNKEVWASQFMARANGIKHKKNLSKSASSKVFEDLNESGIIK